MTRWRIAKGCLKLASATQCSCRANLWANPMRGCWPSPSFDIRPNLRRWPKEEKVIARMFAELWKTIHVVVRQPETGYGKKWMRTTGLVVAPLIASKRIHDFVRGWFHARLPKCRVSVGEVAYVAHKVTVLLGGRSPRRGRA